MNLSCSEFKMELVTVIAFAAFSRFLTHFCQEMGFWDSLPPAKNTNHAEGIYLDLWFLILEGFFLLLSATSALILKKITHFEA